MADSYCSPINDLVEEVKEKKMTEKELHQVELVQKVLNDALVSTGIDLPGDDDQSCEEEKNVEESCKVKNEVIYFLTSRRV